MDISISNIAWDVAFDEEIAALLTKHNIKNIDIAPGKYFSDINSVSSSEITKVKNWWAERGIGICGMQSLLYGTQGLNLFADKETQSRMINHLRAVFRIAGELEALKVVFGSPKNRDRGNLSDLECMDTATDFFYRLGEEAKVFDVSLCLEPNPACYGANFMLNSEETADVVKTVNHPNVKMQLDTGALTINNEEPASVLQRFASLIGHVHVSEPDLVPVGAVKTDHARMADAVAAFLPRHTVTIEMLTKDASTRMHDIESALKTVNQYYGSLGKEER